MNHLLDFCNYYSRTYAFLFSTSGFKPLSCSSISGLCRNILGFHLSDPLVPEKHQIFISYGKTKGGFTCLLGWTRMPARKEWKGKKIIISVSKDEKLHAKREQVEPKLLARDKRLIKLSLTQETSVHHFHAAWSPDAEISNLQGLPNFLVLRAKHFHA